MSLAVPHAGRTVAGDHEAKAERCPVPYAPQGPGERAGYLDGCFRPLRHLIGCAGDHMRPRRFFWWLTPRRIINYERPLTCFPRQLCKSQFSYACIRLIEFCTFSQLFFGGSGCTYVWMIRKAPVTACDLSTACTSTYSPSGRPHPSERTCIYQFNVCTQGCGAQYFLQRDCKDH